MEWHVAEKEMETLPAGEVLLNGRCPHEALVFLEPELERMPSLRNLNNTAIAYRQLGKFKEAEDLVRRASSLDPSRPEPWHNLGHILEEQGRWSEAEDCYVRALALSKGGDQDRLTRYALGTCMMQRQSFQDAWKFWDEGREGNAYPILPNLPQWRGEPLEGKRIIVMREGGFGDVFLLFRYLGALKERGAHVTYHSWKPQASILRGHPWVDEVIDSEQIFQLENYDYQISIQSILEYIEPCPLPMSEPYFHAQNPREFPSPSVGLCWPAGEVVNTYRKYRSIPLAQFERFRAIEGVHWVSLQVSEDTPLWMEPTPKGWSKTADVIAGLDLVISSNTSVCHLAAAMGKPTWLILQLNSEWFWFLDSEDTPWYPSMRIFRNTDPLDFTPAVGRAVDALQVWRKRYA